MHAMCVVQTRKLRKTKKKQKRTEKSAINFFLIETYQGEFLSLFLSLFLSRLISNFVCVLSLSFSSPSYVILRRDEHLITDIRIRNNSRYCPIYSEIMFKRERRREEKTWMRRNTTYACVYTSVTTRMMITSHLYATSISMSMLPFVARVYKVFLAVSVYFILTNR